MSSSTEEKQHTKKRGAFILLEGMDRAGKSTQCEMLHSFLNKNGFQAEHLRFPDRTTAIGKMINSYLTDETVVLDDKCIHLLFSANRWEAATKIRSLLDAGTTLVVDRYSYSGVAFSVSKGLDRVWCMNPEIGLPKPDVVLYLTLSVEEAEKRGGFGQERYEKAEMQKKVSEIFLTLKNESWQVLDAGCSIDELHSKIAEIALSTIEAVAHSPVKDMA
eukprot:CAMPEP_0175095532 /NCGR_PEP_ID=MMETSP0086_2-20121207/4209_1 /TAXON_ID=136419 /ORGANISM="Unknown Unknown, Strain D1" /LENGTH=217 /DNA_ID=CAMNT_0016368793 /DNA_START=141 /DNA_END=794 /DNA_ORIENTATION=-